MSQDCEWDIKIAQSDFSYIDHTTCSKSPDMECFQWKAIRNTVCMWCAKPIPKDLLKTRDWRNQFYHRPEPK